MNEISEEMNVKVVPIDSVVPYPNNPRDNEDAVTPTAESIKQFGWQQPIVVDKNNVVIVGHTRLKAAKKLKLKTVPILVADKLTDEQVNAYRLADNKTGELAEWNTDMLLPELDDITNINMEDFGFDLDELAKLDDQETLMDKIKDNPAETNLFDSFLIPPFSILDSTRSEWTNRKNKWIDIGIKSEVGRTDDLAYSSNEKMGNINRTGTSIFDPVLTELIYRWFMPDDNKGTKIFDPFAGGLVRGIVAAMLNKSYLGIDLRKEQIEANIQNAQDIGVVNPI